MKQVIIIAAMTILSSHLFAQTVKLSDADLKLIEWFDQGEWYKGIEAKPGPSVDKLKFAKHYAKYPERWQSVFEFMRNNDLKTIPLGRKDLNDHVYVNVQEYTTKEPGDQRLEKHGKYIDVQCVISGSELMGSCKIEGYEVQIPFDANRDVGFFKSKGVTPFYVATSELFFIFFPDEIHATNIQFGEKAPVRKVVFKVMYE